jgi:cytochrome c553
MSRPAPTTGRVVAALALLVASCSSSSSALSTDAASASGGSTGVGGVPGVGGVSGAGGTATGGGLGSSGASMADVQAIFDARCIICHDASKNGLPAFPSMPLTDGASRASLVSQPASETCGGILVVPGNPEQSYLMQKLTNPAPCSGSRMPRPFEVGPVIPLSTDQIATITAWISAGAPL